MEAVARRAPDILSRVKILSARGPTLPQIVYQELSKSYWNTMAAIRPARCFNATFLRPRTASAFKLSSRSLGAASVRHKSGPYGYTQAKALVFSKPGEPADVLK